MSVATLPTEAATGGQLLDVRLDPWQQRFFLDEARVQLVCWARQLGKDFTTAAKAVMGAMQTGESWYIVSLTQRQADQTFAKCREWATRIGGAIGELTAADLPPRHEYDAQLD